MCERADQTTMKSAIINRQLVAGCKPRFVHFLSTCSSSSCTLSLSLALSLLLSSHLPPAALVWTKQLTGSTSIRPRLVGIYCHWLRHTDKQTCTSFVRPVHLIRCSVSRTNLVHSLIGVNLFTFPSHLFVLRRRRRRHHHQTTAQSSSKATKSIKLIQSDLARVQPVQKSFASVSSWNWKTNHELATHNLIGLWSISVV